MLCVQNLMLNILSTDIFFEFLELKLSLFLSTGPYCYFLNHDLSFISLLCEQFHWFSFPSHLLSFLSKLFENWLCDLNFYLHVMDLNHQMRKLMLNMGPSFTIDKLMKVDFLTR